METEKITTDNFVEENKTSKSNISQDLFQQPANKSSKPTIAGILLIISGAIALIFWIPAIITIDIAMIESMVDISQFQESGYPHTTVGKEPECSFSLHSLRHPWLRSLRILALSPSWLQDQNTPLQENPVTLLLSQICFWTRVTKYTY